MIIGLSCPSSLLKLVTFAVGVSAAISSSHEKVSNKIVCGAA